MIHKRVLYLAVAFISFLGLMLLGHFFLRPSSLRRVSVLDGGWNVSYNGTEFTDVKLSKLRELIGSGTAKGDEIILSRTVEDLSIYSAPTVTFESRFSAWRVNCDYKMIGEQFYNFYEDGRYISCENNYVTLPEYDHPVTLEIELLVAEDDAYYYFKSPALGSYLDILLYTVYNNLFVTMCSAFLILFGLFFFVISIGFRSAISEVNMQIFSSLLFITLGIWFLTQFNILDLFVDTHGHQTELEYISLYLCVPLMYMVIGCMQDYIRNKKFLFFFITGTIVAILPIFLHYAGIAHINRFLVIYQLDALVLLIFMLTMLAKDLKNHRITPSQTIQLVGQIALSLSFIFNVIFYYLEVAGVAEQILLSKKAVPMGTMCMVFATLVNYQIYISESFARHKEYASLSRLAYADGLTDLPNRSSMEKYLSALDKKEDDYCIISIDLNGLKTVNDTRGHLMGDQYLTEFSSALSSCFNDYGFVARIGGDEFVVVLSGINIVRADYLIERLNNTLNDMNKKDSMIRRSAAAGFAFRHESDSNDWNSTYLLADERMYKNKVIMHEEIAKNVI